MKKILFAWALLLSAPAFASVDENLLNEMLTSVDTDYLQPVNVADLVINGLQAITDLDKDIVISKGSDKFYLYYKLLHKYLHSRIIYCKLLYYRIPSL